MPSLPTVESWAITGDDAACAGRAGPPLDGVADRSILAGQLPNTPSNMAKWIRNPQSIEPNTAMPNVGVDEPTARDMVAYLYSLR